MLEYGEFPLSTLKVWATEKGLELAYHPTAGCAFISGEKVVGITGSDRREILAFILNYGNDPAVPEVAP